MSFPATAISIFYFRGKLPLSHRVIVGGEMVMGYGVFPYCASQRSPPNAVSRRIVSPTRLTGIARSLIWNRNHAVETADGRSCGGRQDENNPSNPRRKREASYLSTMEIDTFTSGDAPVGALAARRERGFRPLFPQKAAPVPRP
jgi:hypothetical protein